MASKYTAEVLAPIVKASQCMAEVLAHLGLRPTGGNYRHLNARVRALQLNTDHFTGSRWAKGQNRETSAAIERMAIRLTIPDNLIFVENCNYCISGPKLAKRLIKHGRKYVCEKCGINEWEGSPLTLHLDHINGINNDHRLENLRFLCPNCHQQTDTWGARNSRRK